MTSTTFNPRWQARPVPPLHPHEKVLSFLILKLIILCDDCLFLYNESRWAIIYKSLSSQYLWFYILLSGVISPTSLGEIIYQLWKNRQRFMVIRSQWKKDIKVKIEKLCFSTTRGDKIGMTVLFLQVQKFAVWSPTVVLLLTCWSSCTHSVLRSSLLLTLLFLLTIKVYSLSFKKY